MQAVNAGRVLAGLMFGALSAAGQTPDELQPAVEATLREEEALSRLQVSVAEREVTLRGPVGTLWEKTEALRRTFDIAGVDTVVSEIDILIDEDDERLAENVGRAIQRYPHYRIWDYLDGRLNQGVVTLNGRVTPERNKADEIFERIAKVQGVQDVQMNVEMLPVSREDERIRRAIGRRLFASEHFERFAPMAVPPFHIIVDNSVVTLVGFVPSQIERIEMHRIVGQTQGVRRVDNQLQMMR